MTKEDLEKLCGLKAEIRLLKRELDNLPATKDSVKGSMTEFPYIQQTIVIKGINEEKNGRLRRKMNQKLSDLQNEMERLEEFLDGVPDPEMRVILRLRYRNGLSWQRIAIEIGSAGDGSAERKKCSKFLDSI